MTADHRPHPPSPHRPALVPAVVRAMALLELLAKERKAMGLGQLASNLALPKSSAHGLCRTLTTLGYLRRQSDGAFLIGPRVMSLSHAFVDQATPAQEFDRFWRDRDQPQETVILSVLDGTDVVYVAVRSGVRPLGMAFTVGMRLPAWRTATGRAMLAFRAPEALKQLFPQPRLPAILHYPAMRRSALMAELDRTRERGHGIDDEGIRQGVYCLAVPVFGPSNDTVAGVGICLQKAVLTPRLEVQQRRLVSQVAQQLSRRLGAPGT
ncbi:MAG: IclR family transcriptional regulator [Pseudomonadota bacterium]